MLTYTRYALVASETRQGFAYVLDTQSPKRHTSVVDAVLFFGPEREAAALAQAWNSMARAADAILHRLELDAQEADMLGAAAQVGRALAETLIDGKAGA